MQKITILAILLSVITISITLELVTQDYIQKVHPEIEETIQANVLKVAPFTDYIDSKNTIDQASQAEEIKQKAEELKQEITTEDSTESTTAYPTSPRLDSLLVALDISRLQYEPQAPTTKIFNLVELSDLGQSKNIYGTLTSNQKTIASISEITSENEKKSQQIYQELKALAGSIKGLNINETNDYGDKSFYINPEQENKDAFLVMQKGTMLYALAYNKSFHDSFHAWFELLL